MTRKQVEELEFQLNHYSFLKDLNEKLGHDEDSKMNFDKMNALMLAAETLGYETHFKYFDKKNGVDYQYYKLVKA